jgi:hypothetical protein
MTDHRQQACITTTRFKEFSHVLRIEYADSAATTDDADDGAAHITHGFINLIAGNVHQHPLKSVRSNPLRVLDSSTGSRLQKQQDR